MKKIAFFNSIPTWGGGEKWHFETGTYLSEKGWEVFYFIHPEGKIAKRLKEFPNIKIIPVQLNNFSFLNRSKIKSVEKELRNHSIETIVINTPDDLKVAGHAAKLAETNRVIYRRGLPVPIKNSFLNRYIFKNWVTEILTDSQATKKAILAKNAKLFPKDKITVIYNGVDASNLKVIDFIAKNSDKEFIIGTMGRLSFEKNQSFMIDLSKELKNRNIEHRILIAGTGKDEKKLREYSIQSGTEETVSFLGFQDDISAFFNQIDVFLLPSLWESFGYVLVEAGISRIPVIAFNESSMPEVVDNGKSGFLIEKNNINQAIEKIQLLSDKNLRKEMGNYGREFCLKKFDKETRMKELETYFNN